LKKKTKDKGQELKVTILWENVDIERIDGLLAEIYAVCGEDSSGQGYGKYDVKVELKG